ncbi:MAG: hypothetical protein Q9165_000844 [Trypethelium subeluteriae]
MFTVPAPSPPTLSTSTSPASPTSPTRSSGRLRGLSYLRSYTHNHLHLHSSAAPTSSSRPPFSRSTSTPSPGCTSESATGPANTEGAEGAVATRTQSHSGKSEPSSASHQSISGWLPAGGDRSGASQVSTQTEPTPAEPVTESTTTNPTSSRDQLSTTTTMTRNGSSSAAESVSRPVPAPHAPVDTRARGESAPNLGPNGPQIEQMPLIRFIPFQEPRSSRPSLNFSPVSRTLPSSWSVIRVGRYSERDNNPEIPENVPSAAPVGFKSKVVSRRHCEFWCQNGQWYIKDVKSSSGTFLNHIRLSQPGVESKPYKVQDGDIVQLGIDFRGGEEMIFRCVKIRIECNRGWQKGLNSFKYAISYQIPLTVANQITSKSTHKRIRNLAKSTSQGEGDAASTHTSECAICLMSIAVSILPSHWLDILADVEEQPCQSLFVAPCSHVWHYKCVRPMLNDQVYPQFQCPNCRAMADLEADVDDPPSDFEEEWEEAPAETQEKEAVTGAMSTVPENPITHANGDTDEDGASVVEGDDHTALPSQLQNFSLRLDNNPIDSISDSTLRVPRVAPVPIGSNPSISAGLNGQLSPPGSATSFALTRAETAASDGPMTPRNDAGPFILDGSAGRAERQTGIGNLESVVQEE